MLYVSMPSLYGHVNFIFKSTTSWSNQPRSTFELITYCAAQGILRPFKSHYFFHLHTNTHFVFETLPAALIVCCTVNQFYCCHCEHNTYLKLTCGETVCMSAPNLPSTLHGSMEAYTCILKLKALQKQPKQMN